MSQERRAFNLKSLIYLGLGCVLGVVGTFAALKLDSAVSANAAAWGSAIATSIAVVVALYVSNQQIDVAKESAKAERQAAIDLQEKAANDEAKRMHVRAMRLAHAFSRELVLARRDLMVFLANTSPPLMEQPSQARLAMFVSVKPLPELHLMGRFADQLEGFEDEDAFAILTLLAAWNNFNRSPGMGSGTFLELSNERRWKMAENRFKAGRDVVHSIGRLCNALAGYYELHPSMQATVIEDLPEELTALFG
jgi:hypothetical protein